MKTKITILITVLLSGTIGFAQKANDYVGHVTLLKRNAQLSVSAGTMIPSSNTTSGTNLVNSNVFSINAAKSVFKERGPYKKPPRYIINYVNIGAAYINGNQDYNIGNLVPYNIQGQTTNPTSSEKGNGSPKNVGFKLETGARVDMHFGNFVVSPVFNVGYLNMKQKGFNVEQTSTLGSSTSSYNLLTQSNSNISGLALIPKLRFTYEISNKIGLWIESNYTFGPSFSTESTRFMPSGSPDQNGQYNIDDMLTGTNVKSKTETKFRAMELNFGLSFSLSKAKETKPTAGTLNPPPTSNPNPPLSAPTTSGGTVPIKSLQKPIKRSVPRWGRYTTNINGCELGGVYCLKNRLFTENIKLERDESINETTVELIDNNIIVKSFAITSNISKETKNAFINKKIETKDSEIPRDILNEWLTMIELPQQEKGVIIKKENHTYKIFEDKFEDKKVSIIVSDQKTTININGKEYKIRIITTSDYGPGCPGPGRNLCF